MDTDKRIKFLKQKIQEYQSLKAKASSPERVESIIKMYVEELSEITGKGLSEWT